MSVFLLKQVASSYVSRGTPVFAVFLDASKAVVLNWGCSHPQRVREGTFWGANFSSQLLFSTKNNTSNGARGAKNDFSFWMGCGL